MTPARIQTRLALAFMAALALGLGSGTAKAQQALPIGVGAETLTTLGVGPTYTVDLSTTANRPVLIVEVTPDSAHLDMQLEVQFSNWTGSYGGGGFACLDMGSDVTYLSSAPFSPLVCESDPFRCELGLLFCQPNAPSSTTWAGNTVDVTVRATSFGAAGAPADVTISIRSESRIPTGTLSAQVDTVVNAYSDSFSPSKDTALYEENASWSTGAGAFLWAGQDYERIVVGQFVITRRDGRRPLLAFDLSSTIASHATITNAQLFTYVNSTVGGGGVVSLYAVGADRAGTWDEGDAIAAGSGFADGAASTSPAANWTHRSNTSIPWTAEGGDGVLPLLGSFNVAGTGAFFWASPALTSAVQSMVTSGQDEDGFILYGPGGPLVSIDMGVQFVSREYILQSLRPRLDVDYTVEEIQSAGNMPTGAVSFISEGEDFRWIYDLDQDDVFVTDINGVCDATPPMSGYSGGIPYTYDYQGEPNFQGVDCCSWQIESPSTGTTGTGQALFFHDLDPFDPENIPPDTDGDGMVDLCDNCLAQPNGPLQGTCLDGAVVGGPCHSDLDCSGSQVCQLSQEDADSDGYGDVCPAPEPSFGLGLLGGSALLATLRRRARPTHA